MRLEWVKKMKWALKYVRFEAQRHRVLVGLNLLVLLLVALAMHALMRGKGLWGDIDGDYAVVMVSQTLSYALFILSAFVVNIFALLFGQRDGGNANIYQLKLSPHSIYALQALRFAFFFVSLCIYVLLLLLMSLMMSLPTEMHGFYRFLFAAGAYLLFALLLPVLACVFLCVAVNSSYSRGGKALAVLQAMGFCAFWFYLLPMHFWGMLAEVNILPRLYLDLPPIDWKALQLQQMSISLAPEPLLISMLFTCICIYLAGRVAKETEV